MDHTKNTNIHIIWGSQKEKREREGGQNVFDEIMAENLPNLNKEADIQVLEANRSPQKNDSNWTCTKIYQLKWEKDICF